MPRYGDLVARSLQGRVGKPTATEAALKALGTESESRVDGCLTTVIADYSVWVFDADSTAAAQADVLVPDAGSGRYHRLDTLGGGGALKARAVVTSLAANTVTAGVMLADANGALGAQDGVSVAAGDVIFIQEGTTNLDNAQEAGPWVIDVLGTAGTKFQLKRPIWWAHGSTIQQGAVIDIGGEGTTYPGTQWKTFAGTGKLVGTDAPVFWAKEVQGSSALVAGTFTISQPVRSTTKTLVNLHRIVANTSTATTGGYHPTVGGANGLTAGVKGTGQAVVEATVAAGTINNADISTLAWAIQNW